MRRIPKSGNSLPEGGDAIPAGTISLSEAYMKVLAQLTDHDLQEGSLAKTVASEIEELMNEFTTSPSATSEVEKLLKELTSDYDRWEFHAAAFLRHFLYEGALFAYVRDPETGEKLRLISSEWGIWYNSLTRFFSSDYVRPSLQPDPSMPKISVVFSQPGPGGTFIRGALRPVFFLQDEFDQWFAEVFSAKTKTRSGRPPGSGSWNVTDEPLLNEMREAIVSGQAKSPDDAARLFADRASGSGTPASKQTRLAKKYRMKFLAEKK